MRFLIPAFICVNAEDAEAADQAVADWREPQMLFFHSKYNPRLYLDESLPTVEIPDGDLDKDPHSLLEVSALEH